MNSSAAQPTGVRARAEETNANRTCLDQNVMDPALPLVAVAGVKWAITAEDRHPDAPETWQTLATSPAFRFQALPMHQRRRRVETLREVVVTVNFAQER